MAGKRYNSGKLRYELLPFEPIKEVVKVYTNGAHKYTVYEDEVGTKILGKDIAIEEVVQKQLKIVEDGSNNWMNGMSLMQTIACAERHIADWKSGVDIDPDPIMKTKHLANAIWNLITVLELSRIKPQFDDRKSKAPKKIGLDIDGVLADFIGHLMKVTGNEGYVPYHWNDPLVVREFNKIKGNEDFWASIPPLLKREDIPFEPFCYITARSIDPDITQEWLNHHGFPLATLHCVPYGASKVEIAKESGLDIFVDDSYSNYLELLNGGIDVYLYNALYNEKYNVGHRRIYSLKELVK